MLLSKSLILGVIIVVSTADLQLYPNNLPLRFINSNAITDNTRQGASIKDLSDIIKLDTAIKYLNEETYLNDKDDIADETTNEVNNPLFGITYDSEETTDNTKEMMPQFIYKSGKRRKKSHSLPSKLQRFEIINALRSNILKDIDDLKLKYPHDLLEILDSEANGLGKHDLRVTNDEIFNGDVNPEGLNAKFFDGAEDKGDPLVILKLQIVYLANNTLSTHDAKACNHVSRYAGLEARGVGESRKKYYLYPPPERVASYSQRFGDFISKDEDNVFADEVAGALASNDNNEDVRDLNVGKLEAKPPNNKRERTMFVHGNWKDTNRLIRDGEYSTGNTRSQTSDKRGTPHFFEDAGRNKRVFSALTRWKPFSPADKLGMRRPFISSGYLHRDGDVVSAETRAGIRVPGSPLRWG